MGAEARSQRDAQGHQKQRQRIGAQAEKVLVAMFDACALAGLGVLRKRPTNIVVHEGIARHTGTAGCDFSGHLRGGRAAYLEAKHTDGPRFSFAMLRETQRAELARAHADGALAAVAVLVGPLVCAWVSVVPWSVVAEHLAAGAASLPPDVLEAWRVPPRVLLLAGGWVTEAGGAPCR